MGKHYCVLREKWSRERATMLRCNALFMFLVFEAVHEKGGRFNRGGTTFAKTKTGRW